MDKIFISIASYRDPELVPTIRNIIAKADFPERLVFGVAWQHDEKESLGEYYYDPRFRILDIDYRQSQGACWARYMIQKLCKDEKYYMQLDSHHRFVEHWDTKCINTIKLLQEQGHPKPLLTGYIPSYDPANDPDKRVMEPWKMNFDRFTPEGVVFFLPATIDDWKERNNQPIPARFFSAHFVFTLGKWPFEVPYDPYYYFHGEEINLAARSYTHGYDLFHTTEIIAWHEYTRKGRTKQWDDDKDWGVRNTSCHIRNRKLFGMDDEKQDINFGPFGFGTVRSLRDYEKYAGISFKLRGVQKYTKENKIAPNPPVTDFDASIERIFKHCIDIGYDKVPETDYTFWCVAFKDVNGNDIYRQDADAAEIERMKRDPDGYCKLWREFVFTVKPHSWIVWPFSQSKGWCAQITGTL